jgi:sigma-B regulation protein RsbU (phosphoserine phosphatase)
LKGIVSFEWYQWDGDFTEDARLSALLVASFCLSAAASTAHQSALKQLRLREEQMEKELADAEHYVRQVLPPPLTGEIDVSWKLKPSAQLGGDAFGYHWIDEDRFAIYLLDVVGHGTGAALLSISAMNSVRAQILPDTDFGNPAAVLTGLNGAFQMETQNDMTFTVWYGIYQRSTKSLVYASAGHPPALLIDPNRASHCTELSTDGLIIGHMDDFEYENAAVRVPAGGKLYVLSDGAFEIERPDGEMWPYEQFVAAVRSTGSMQDGEVDYLYERTQQILEGAELQDDFTMLRVRFPD